MKKILLILALLPTLIFADAVIFSGNDVKALKQNLDLFGVVKILSGNLDPSVSGLPAPVGSQYNSTNGKVYVKKGVLDTQWEESQTGLINLSSDVSGVLPTSNGGTGSLNLGTGVVKASGVSPGHYLQLHGQFDPGLHEWHPGCDRNGVEEGFGSQERREQLAWKVAVPCRCHV